MNSRALTLSQALDFTAVGNALIFSNSQSILLLLGKFFVGERVSVLEAAGAIIAFTGATLCSKDSADSAPAGGMKAILGDFYALLSAIGGVAYLVFAKTVRPYVNLYVFMFLIMFIGSLMTLLFMIGHPISFDFDVSQYVLPSFCRKPNQSLTFDVQGHVWMAALSL